MNDHKRSKDLNPKNLIRLILLISFFCFSLTFNQNQVLAQINNSDSCPEGMAYIQGGTFRMGSENQDFVEEETVDDVTVDSFCIDRHEITNKEFSQFVESTGYITIAERSLSPEEFPQLSEAERKPGSLVFQPPEKGVKKIPYLSWCSLLNQDLLQVSLIVKSGPPPSVTHC